MLTAEIIKEVALELGSDIVGIAEAGPVEDKDKYLDWLHKGYAGEMDYLAEYQNERFDPGELLPAAKSIITVGLNYYPYDEDIARMKEPYRVAKYAWGDDYHATIRKLLKNLRRKLKETEPSLNGRICVDTAPFMDVYWAEKAGIGWRGKHTCLVSTKLGCWLNIGSLVIDKEVSDYDAPHKNRCGVCTACIKACPTGAILAPYELDATKCISYWNIESKAEHFPEHIKRNLRNFVFGCDICIGACPFNRFAGPHSAKEYSRRENAGIIETGAVNNLTENQFKEFFFNSPILRPGLQGIKRNIAAARYHPNKS